MTGVEYVLSALAAEGVDHLFMVPGGLVDPLLMAFAQDRGVRPIVAAHEGGAAFMAYGYAKGSGRFGVCAGIGGPGLSNMVTALASASADQVPVLALSGGVPADQQGRGSFQDATAVDLDEVVMLKPVTRFSKLVPSPQALPGSLLGALRFMSGTPRGAVHLCLPQEVQTETVEGSYERMPEAIHTPRTLDTAALDRIWEYLQGAEKVAVLAGRGVEASGACDDLAAFADRFDVPVMTTLGGKGVFPETNEMSLGYFGFAGTRHAVETVFSECIDVLIVLGSGLTQYDSYYWTPHLQPKRALVQIDLNPRVLGRFYSTQVPVVGDVRSALRHLLASPRSAALDATSGARRKWLASIRAEGPRCYNEADCDSLQVPIHPARIARELRDAMPDNTILVSDGGAHIFFTMHYWRTRAARQHYLALGIGAMGWAIPGGIGIALARPEDRVLVVTGDGCMHMHGMELSTAARFGVRVVYVVYNNSAHGNVYSRVRLQAPEAAWLTEIPTRDWAMFARSLGVPALTVEKPEELAGAFAQAVAAEGPFLVDVRCSRDVNVPAGRWGQATQEWAALH